MKRIKSIVSAIIFFTLIIGCGKFLRYLVTDDTTSYTRVTFHEMYEQDNIDILFVGSSHCYRSFIPSILDEEIGVNTFNAGTSSQALDGSLMIIKEVAKYNDLKHIYLELYFNVAFAETYKKRNQLTQTYIISDYLRPSFDKFNYLLNASSKEHYSNGFIVARRNWEKLYDPAYILELVRCKQNSTYKNYEYDFITNDYEWYAGKGFVASKGNVEGFYSTSGWDRINIDKISEDWIFTLNKIISLCNKNNIAITLISAPMSDFYLSGMENYDEYVEYVDRIIAGTGVEYVDFNMCKEDYFVSSSEYFKDVDHLNLIGAEAFSHAFSLYYNNYDIRDGMFYGSYNEKLGDMEPSIFGIGHESITDKNGDDIDYCRIVSSNSDLEYKIIVETGEGKSELIRDYSTDKLFLPSSYEHGIYKVFYRQKYLPKTEHFVNIAF